MDEVSINQLRDIFVPAAPLPSPWPAALLALSIVTSLVALTLYLRARKYPWRQQALEELRQIQQQPPTEQYFLINRLLQRILIALGDAHDSQHNNGADQANRLNQSLRTTFFSQHSGRQLVDGRYAPQPDSLPTSVFRQLDNIIERRTRWPW